MMSGMDPAHHPGLARIVARAREDADVLAVLLFGSRARGDATQRSDIDVCLVLAPDRLSRLAPADKQLDYAAVADIDVAVFQRLPLHVRTRALKEGKILFVRDEDALYDVAFGTARAWERFRHIHREYLEEVARG